MRLSSLQVIAGWTEAMPLMKEGDHWQLFIPSELAYGDRGSGSKIPGGSALIFEIEILKVKEPSPYMFMGFDFAEPKTIMMAVLFAFMLFSNLSGGGGSGNKGPKVRATAGGDGMR